MLAISGEDFYQGSMFNAMRFVYCLLFACLFGCVVDALADVPGPSLLYEDSDGKRHQIVGMKYLVGKNRLYYLEGEGEENYLQSLKGILLGGNLSKANDYSILAERYWPERRVSTNVDQSVIVLKEIEFGDRVLKAAPYGYVDQLLYLLAWRKSAEEFVPLYANKEIEDLPNIQLPQTEGFSGEGVINGYLVLFMFKNGDLVLPDPSICTLSDFLDPRSMEMSLSAAASNGFVDYLVENLPKRYDKDSDYSLLPLLSAATTTGRVEVMSALLDFLLKLSNEGKIRAKELKEHWSTVLGTFVNRSIAMGYEDVAIAILKHPAYKPLISKKSERVAETVLSGNFKLADAFIEAGYPAFAEDDRRATVIKICLISNRLDYVERFCAKRKLRASELADSLYTTIYHYVAATANIETLEFLKQFDIPIDEENKDNFTPLIYAAGYGNIPAVGWFLDNGARIDARNAKGHTALQYSIVKQQSEATSYILQYSPDVNLIGPKGVTPLMQAVLFRDTATIAAIEAAGGTWNLYSPYLDHCLRFALEKDLASTISLALQAGLPESYLLYRKWPLTWLAHYYAASECVEVFESDLEFNAQSSMTSEDDIQLIDVDKRRLKEFLGKVNARQPLTFSCLLNSSGKTDLVRLETPLDRFAEGSFLNLAATIQFGGKLVRDMDAASLCRVRIVIGNLDKLTSFEPSLEVISTEMVSMPRGAD